MKPGLSRAVAPLALLTTVTALVIALPVAAQADGGTAGCQDHRVDVQPGPSRRASTSRSRTSARRPSASPAGRSTTTARRRARCPWTASARSPPASPRSSPSPRMRRSAASGALGAEVKILAGNTTNLGRADEINIFNGPDAVANLVDRLTYNDQGTGTVKGPRTQGVAGIPMTEAALGANDASQWQLSVVGDVEGSRASTAGDIGSPGSEPVRRRRRRPPRLDAASTSTRSRPTTAPRRSATRSSCTTAAPRTSASRAGCRSTAVPPARRPRSRRSSPTAPRRRSSRRTASCTSPRPRASAAAATA